MKLIPVLILASVFTSTAGMAVASSAVAAKNACLTCHAPDKKLVGPSYQSVAEKYAANKNAESLIMASIKKGGSGKWGVVPMPPQPNVSDADLQILAKWILAGAK